MMKRRTVILANGAFPRRGSPAYRLLAEAGRVVCCDGAADAYRLRFRREPAAVVGDCDSVRGRFANVVRVADQDTNDLEKAVAYCRDRKWRSPVIVGATGKRDDHSLGNIFRAFACGLEIVTDDGRFLPVDGRRTLSVGKGAAVSVFAPDRGTRMTSRGLEWPLDGVVFDTLFCATLNRATCGRIALTSDRPVYVYHTFRKEEKAS